MAAVIKDLVSQGLSVALPLADHLPFDLVVIDANYQLYRLSVKHSKLTNGSIIGTTRSVYAKKNKNVVKKLDKTTIDFIAIYCPDNDQCYYVPTTFFENKTSVYLRVSPTSGKKVVNKAEEFRLWNSGREV